MKSYQNFSDLFLDVAKRYNSAPVINWKEKDGYANLTGLKLKELVYHTAKAMEKLKLQPGDKAAILSETRFEWVVADFACISNQIITVPIYTTMTSSQIKFILEHSESRLCFVSSKLMAEKVSAVFNELPKLQKIISFNKLDNEPEYIISFEELIYGELIHEHEPYNEIKADEYFTSCINKHKPDDILTIIYTSGTTGNPKGVCLSHKNIISNAIQCLNSFHADETDKFLSFLPLAHTYERTAGYYVPLVAGSQIFYAQSIETLQTQMAEVKPTILLTVPLLFTRIQTRILKNIESLKGMKKFFAKRALAIGMKYRENKKNLFWKGADKKVFKEIRERTGGKIRFMISGGSALKKETAEFFDSIGITILQGYGMTEASPVISVNREAKNIFGTVGLPLEGVKVKLAPDGEILVKGDNVMLGYYHNQTDTNEMIVNGWLHTGDIGEFDKNGYLIITDRKKSLIKTAGGKYISLTHIEDTLTGSEYIDQVIAFASDERHFVSALIVPEFEKLKELAAKLNIKSNEIRELTQSDIILNFYESEIDVLQRPLAKYERVRKFALLDRPFTIESGELTPTLKLKRKVIEDRYKDLIDSFYKK
ncbi:MAG TPA: long-chain fatty acid--CoA ligase [Ignavibacteria bacterium]|jgi:long-chain acyl-CoA synthetase